MNAPPDPTQPARRQNFVIAAVRGQPLLAFFVLAFALTWAALPWNSFLAAGPLIAALVITGIYGRAPGSRRWKGVALGQRSGMAPALAPPLAGQ